MGTAWQGSKKAETWKGRSLAVSAFQTMAAYCRSIARSLDHHRDADAVSVFGHLCSHFADAMKYPVFGKRACKAK